MIDETEYLQGLSEEEFRNIVVIPLLKHMGLRGVIEYHGGSPEKGKDIIGYYHGPLEDRHYVAVVVKKGDIHGSVSKHGSVSEVLFQMEQSLNEPYTDIYDLKEVRFDECWVVTSGEIKNTAIESIRGKLAKANLDKVARFIDRTRLMELLAVHMPGFWHRDRHILTFVHEIRGPLVAIRSLADFVRRRGESMDADRRDRALSDIDADSQMCLRLVEMLDFAHRKEAEPRMAPFNAAAMMAKLVSSLPAKDRARVTLRPARVGANRDAVGDQELLAHAIRSVIENALAYSEGEVFVDVAFDDRNSNLALTVTDTGIGVPEGAEERIFDPGYRAANATDVTVHGMGVGLPVARRILRQHHGDVRLTNSGHPTVFSLVVPRS